MDWGNVTAEDLVEALREVDWSSPPRPFSEFFSRFTVPRSYRTNYFIMIVFILGMGFLRRPLAIVAALMTALSIAFLNDSFLILPIFVLFSFAGTFSEKVTRSVRQFSPHLAAKMRAPLTECLPLVCFLWYFYGLIGIGYWPSWTPNLKARLNTFREEFRAVWRNYSEL
ncbi:hypothetical protein DH2020_040243 [Rehmannia glutinosa]|uniref:PRA1 family protein n=1 Tax=Rehmannia glutinosa TaxID=99300 RepID=A0ABR0UUQ2_REHGL